MFFCPNCNNIFTITRNQPTEPPKTSETSEQSEESSPSRIKEVPKSLGSIQEIKMKAYYKCTKCSFFKEIEPRSLILNRSNEKIGTEFVDHNKYKDMIYDKTLPNTRNYICPNKSCISHKNHSERVAVWFRPNMYNNSIKYVCRACRTIW